MIYTAANPRCENLIVGLGETGLSVARHLAAQGVSFAVTDTREAPAGLVRLARIPGADRAWAGPLSQIDPGRWQRVIVSPGISKALPILERAVASGAELIGDIELFARNVRGPVIGITGSNGKSTVTALVGELLRSLGKQVAVGGNFGTPALDLLESDADLYVLELSSFQLETTCSLRTASAAILNISADHLDRYPDMPAYIAAKARILTGAERVVLDRDDPSLMALAEAGHAVTFGLGPPPRPIDFGITDHHGESWLTQGSRPILATRELGLQGRHNWLNALSALALTWPWIDSTEKVTATLRGFVGLPHRSQLVGRLNGVDYIDDSKGTNVGAALASIRGVAGDLILIAGGQGKGQDFTPLADALVGKARGVVLLGVDAQLIASVLHDSVPVRRVDSIEDAVSCAAAWTRPGDTVLLSPACASLDMFASYAERGERFAAAVRGLAS